MTNTTSGIDNTIESDAGTNSTMRLRRATLLVPLMAQCLLPFALPANLTTAAAQNVPDLVDVGSNASVTMPLRRRGLSLLQARQLALQIRDNECAAVHEERRLESLQLLEQLGEFEGDE